jgi:hypothetical protein
VKNILDFLEILLTWVKVHESIFERFESKKFFGFQSFALSHQYANAFKSILGLYMPTSNFQNQTILSVTKMEKLDNLVNSVKVKTLECLNYIYKYTTTYLNVNLRPQCPFREIQN